MGARAGTRGRGARGFFRPATPRAPPGRSLLCSEVGARGHGGCCARITGEPRVLSASLRFAAGRWGPPRARLRSRPRPRRRALTRICACDYPRRCARSVSSSSKTNKRGFGHPELFEVACSGNRSRRTSTGCQVRGQVYVESTLARIYPGAEHDGGRAGYKASSNQNSACGVARAGARPPGTASRAPRAGRARAESTTTVTTRHGPPHGHEAGRRRTPGAATRPSGSGRSGGVARLRRRRAQQRAPIPARCQ